MIGVRPLEPGDEETLIRLTRAMHVEAPHYRPFAFDNAKIHEWAKLCLEHDDWLCLLAFDGEAAIGFIAVGSVEMLFSRERTIDDLGLFVLPAWRGTTAAVRLLRAMEGWASGRGRAIRMGVTTGTNADQAVKFFRRFGYEPTGTLLTKAL